MNTGAAARKLPFFFAGLAVWLLFYLGTYKVLSYIRPLEFIGETMSEKFFSMTFFGLAGFLILSTVVTSLSSFYLSADIPFLLTKPIEIRDILRLKTYESLLNSSWMTITFVPPVLLAYGVQYRAGISYYLIVPMLFVLFILTTGGIGISIAHLLTWLFPAHRVREVFLGAAFFLFLGIYFVIKTAIPHNINGTEDIFRFFIGFRSDLPLLPGYWVTKTAFPLLRNSVPDIFYSVLLLSNSAFFLLLSLFIGAGLYETNRAKTQPSGKGFGGLLRGLYPGPRAAVAYKDIRVFFRDTGQWSQVFIIAALILVYIYNFISIPLDAISGLMPMMKEIMVLLNMTMTGLVLAAVAARFMYTAVSLEGPALWVVKTAPVAEGSFLRSKLLSGGLPLTVVMVLLVFLTNMSLKVSSLLMVLSVWTIFMLCVSVCGLGIGMGGIFPRFRYENIASVSMGIGGMSFMVLAFGLVLVTLSCEAWFYYLFIIKAPLKGIAFPEKIAAIAAFAISILLNAAAFYIPMRIAEKRLSGNIEGI